MTAKPQKRRSLPPIAYLLFGVLMVGLGVRSCSSSPDHKAMDANVDSEALPAVTMTSLKAQRFSEGGEAFFLEDGTADKATALSAYAQKDFAAAQRYFQRSLQQKPNDPEALIYLNNAKASAQNPVKIAVTIPATTDANGARELLRGVAQAQQKVNEHGGINGQFLMVVIANDENRIETAKSIAQDLVNQTDILGVVGHVASSVTLATADIYSQGKLSIISPISSAVQLSNKSPYVFRTVPSDYVAARSLANHMLHGLNRKKAVVYFNSQSDYSQSLKNEFNTAIALQGGQVVGEYDLADSSFSAQKSLATAAQQGADAIMLASSTASLDTALQVVQANSNRLPMLAGDDVYAPKTLDVARELGRGMVLAVPWHSQAESSRAFAQRARQLWKGDVNWRTVTAYDATQAFAAALAQTPSRRGVRQALSKPGLNILHSARSISFLPSGDCNAPVQLVEIATGDRSGLGMDFVPLAVSHLRTLPPQ
jgi:branched-chain amino acid transport system substrate-binding protein